MEVIVAIVNPVGAVILLLVVTHKYLVSHMMVAMLTI
jgi:hypothetical protein